MRGKTEGNSDNGQEGWERCDECLAKEIREAAALIAKRIHDRYACDYALLPSSIPLV